MAISHKRSNRKPTGARYKSVLSKKFHELGSDPTFTKLEPVRKRKIRTKGKNQKIKLFSSENANVLDPKNKTFKIVKVKSVVDNPANRNFIRRNIITKGAVIDTELGKAKVTSRPGQEGTINAVLIS